jgi:hypothetical protein
MADTNTTSVVKGILKPPPRSTGNAQMDLPLLLNWLYEFYLVNQSANQYLDDQTNAGDFDPSKLPDPALSTVASAQDTANKAFTLANSANNLAKDANDRTKGWYRFELTFGAGDGSKTYDFSSNGKDDQTDTDYMVILSPKSYTGSAVLDGFIIIEKSYSTTGFTITLNGAPGTGATITYDGTLIRMS